MAKNKIPTMEELNKLYENLGGTGKLVPESPKKSKKVKVEGPPNLPVESVDNSQVYSEVHFFLRPNQVWAHVLQDAKVEANVRGSNVLVFAHNHIRGAACDHLCREAKGE